MTSRLQALLGNLGETLGSVLDAKVIVGVAVVLIAVAGVRALVIRSVLRSRMAWAVLPADEFDPTPEDVARFAFQISRVRRAFRAWFERPASAVRIRLESVPEGQMLYVIEGPRDSRSVLRSAAYDRVELRERDGLDLSALSLRPDVPDVPPSVDPARPVRGEPPDPEPDDPREDLENDWLKEDRW